MPECLNILLNQLLLDTRILTKPIILFDLLLNNLFLALLRTRLLGRGLSLYLSTILTLLRTTRSPLLRRSSLRSLSRCSTIRHIPTQLFKPLLLVFAQLAEALADGVPVGAR